MTPKFGRLKLFFISSWDLPYTHGFDGEFGESRAGMAYLCFLMSGTSVGRTSEWDLGDGEDFREGFACMSGAWGGRT